MQKMWVKIRSSVTFIHCPGCDTVSVHYSFIIYTMLMLHSLKCFTCASPYANTSEIHSLHAAACFHHEINDQPYSALNIGNSTCVRHWPRATGTSSLLLGALLFTTITQQFKIAHRKINIYIYSYSCWEDSFPEKKKKRTFLKTLS